ncbi:uncharacterized protein LOC144863322 [Branchiostoma floridae x Branchiostoma japonicum]
MSDTGGRNKVATMQWTGFRVSMTTLMMIMGVVAVLIALLPAKAQQPHDKSLRTTSTLTDTGASADEADMGSARVAPEGGVRVRKARSLWGSRRRRASCPCVSYCPRRRCGGWYWYRRCSVVGRYCCKRRCSFYVG